MNYWLLKTEPTNYSFDDLERDKKTCWDGVTSPAGLFHIRAVRKGDTAFIYHTGSEKQVVGICEICSDPYPDPKERNPKIMVFDVKPREKMKIPVTLEQLKKDKRFRKSRIVNEGRLSVQPMPEELWRAIMIMGRM